MAAGSTTYDQASSAPIARRTKRHSVIWVVMFIMLPVVVGIISMCIGRYPISVLDVIKSLWSWITGANTGVDSTVMSLVISYRLPRIARGLLVGAALAASGVAFQSLFRNPLVSSGMLGVSSGAGFGAALAIVLFSGLALTPVFAFAFGILAVILSWLVGRLSGSESQISLVLGGTIVSSIFSALVSLLKFLADPTIQLAQLTYWLMGSLSSIRNEEFFYALFPILIGLIGLLLMRWRLNVLSMGDREAKTLGLNVGFNKGVIVACATLTTAGAVCISGIVGWIGLVVPHICRMLIGNDNKWLVPASISVGACFMVVVDTICRTLTSAEIPLGVVMALVGGPFFIYLLKKTKGRVW